jgi:iron complex transport system permease protein
MERRRKKDRVVRAFLLLGIFTLLFFLSDITFGSVAIPFKDVIKALSLQKADPIWQNIIINFRLPRAITALLVGAGLSVSGLLMQTMFRNPLAGPFVLGISSGASLGVALLIMAGFALGDVISLMDNLGKWLTVVAASGGSLIVLLLVLLTSNRIKDSMGLLIIGLMFGSATSAIVSILQFFSKAEEIQAYLIWTFGSLGGMNWYELNIFIPVVLAGLVLAFSQIKSLNALLLGENYARSMGMKLKRTRFWLILATSLLAGSITAFCGPIAFVGIAVPHLARMLFVSSDHRLLLPATVLAGAALMLFCDLISQLPGTQETLPINAVTSVFGAPVVIWLIVRKRNARLY